MPKTKISEYSATNSANTDIEGINIDEGCPPSSINNAIRELMVHLKEFQTGASGDAFTFAGGTLMSGTNTISGAAVISGNINSSGTTNTFSGGNIFSGTNTFSGTNVFSSDVTLNAQKDLRFADSDSSNWVAFQAPATVSSNVTWTLPAADGTANQALVTNGSGTLSFATAGSSLTGVTDSASPFETALGEGAGGSSTGVNNTFIGFEAGNDNTTGANNTAVGYQALDANTTGQKNTAVGTTALGANTTGTDSVAVGWESLRLATTAQYNVGVGPQTLYSNTTGSRNTAVGSQALLSNTTGTDNIAVGSLDGGSYGPLWSNTTGQYNVGIGGGALGRNTTASNNTAIGYNSLNLNTTGANNTAVGSGALDSNTTGSANTALGSLAGAGQTTGASGGNTGDNVFVGYSAGSNSVTGSASVYVGANCQASGTAVTNEIVLAQFLTGKGTGTFYVGGLNGSYNQKNVTTWETTSDQRLKKNIVDNTEGLEKINAIRVRNFEYRLPEEVTDLPEHTVIAKSGVQLGIIAQELQEVCPTCVTEQSTGVLSVSTDEIFWHMVNAIKDLKAINDAQATRIETLETKVAALEAQLATPPTEPNA
jgi:hypothetical protein